MRSFLSFPGALFLGLCLSVVQAAPKVDRVRMPVRYAQKLTALQDDTIATPWPKVLSTVEATNDTTVSQVDPSFAPTVSAPKENIFASLSNDEAAAVIAFCHKQTSLNLTAAENATAWDNQITVVDILMPNKTDALAYLDSDGPKPKRYAIVTISHGASEEPYVEDIGVGPLPISDETEVVDLSWLSTKGKAQVRKYNADEDTWYEFFVEIASGVKDITKDLINGTVTGGEDDDFDIWGIDPLWHRDGKVVQWVTFWRHVDSDGFAFDATTLLPQGLFFRVDTTGREKANWSVTGWLYNEQFFSSTEAFRAAWEDGSLKKAEQLNSPYEDDYWYGTDREGEAFVHDERLPPVQVAPDGHRFEVDAEQRFVKWMDYTFYFTFTRDTGLRLYDVTYGGQRILFELGLQEAVAHYAGNDPTQSGTSYLDTYYGFGPYAFQLVKGYDCPAYAAYFNATFHAAEESKTHRDAICLFEHDVGTPIQRHSSGTYVSVTKDIALILRSVATVGNYDYSFSYVFHMDGTIETKVSASGYIQSAFYAGNEDYGYQIRQGLSGSMHDHVLTFKADLDIGGTKNSVAQHAVVPVEVDYPWNDGLKRKTMHMERSYIDTETAMNWDRGTHKLLLVVNKDVTDQFGQPIGYRIMPSVGNGHSLTIKESPNLLNSAHFTQDHLYFTQQKDTEPRVANAMNSLDPENPIVDFGKFLDGESLDQEDVVAWFNLGMVHVPDQTDLPNTVQTKAQASMLISPHNYLPSNPSKRTRQMVRIDYGTEGKADKVHTFGKRVRPQGTVDVAAAYPNLWSYAGDEGVRKFPYDPDHPFNRTDSIA